jgi:exosortase
LTISKISDNSWLASIVLLSVIGVVFVIAYFDSIKDLFIFWDESSTYGHGVLLLPISGYLIYKGRDELVKLEPHFTVVGIIALLIAIVLWLMSNLISIQLLVHASLILIIGAIVLATLGYRITKVLLIPILILFLGVNVWFPLEYLFQNITTLVTVFFLRLLDVPLLLEGHTIKLISGQFFVDTSCAGLRYFIVTLLISVVYGFLNIKKSKNLMLIVVLSIVLSIISNWIRVFTIVYVGHLSDMDHPLVDQHVEFGWVLFLVLVMPCFYFLSNYVQRKEQ